MLGLAQPLATLCGLAVQLPLVPRCASGLVTQLLVTLLPPVVCTQLAALSVLGYKLPLERVVS